MSCKVPIKRRLTALVLAAMFCFTSAVSASADTINGNSLTGEAPGSVVVTDGTIQSEGEASSSSSSDSSSNSSSTDASHPPDSSMDETSSSEKNESSSTATSSEENSSSSKTESSSSASSSSEVSSSATSSASDAEEIAKRDAEDQAQYEEFLRQLANLHPAYDDSAKEYLARTKKGRSSPGDTAIIGGRENYKNINSYNLPIVAGDGVPHQAAGSSVSRMTCNGEDTFCVEIWLKANDTTYTATVAYDKLSEGQITQMGQYFANYRASARSDSDYVATQCLIWETAYNLGVGGTSALYRRLISGPDYDPLPDTGNVYTYINDNPSVRAAHMASYNAILNGTASGGGLLFWSSANGVGQVVATFVDHAPPGTPLTLFKHDANNKTKGLAGAKFDVKYKDSKIDSKTYSVTTDASGKAPVALTKAGDVTITETKAPSGYKISQASTNATVALNKPITVNIPNKSDGGGGGGDDGGGGDGNAFGQVTITKKDDEGASLDGAIFNIQITFSNGATGGDSHFEVTDGTRTFYYNHPKNNTDAATIRITEVQAPPGYVMDGTPQTVTVSPTYTKETLNEKGEIIDTTTIMGDTPTVTFVNPEAECTLIIYKYQKGNSTIPLAGGQFTVSYVDPSVDSGRWAVTTGADGKATIKLPKAGAILIHEDKAPEGYVISVDGTGNSMADTTVTISRGETKQVDIPNDKKGEVIVIKKDNQNGAVLAGATFTITDIKTGVSKQGTTGADGRVIFNDLDPGEYRIEETSPPQYYELSGEVKTVQIREGSTQTIELEFRNEPWTGLTIYKVDAKNANGLAGAIFDIYEGSGLTQDGKPQGAFMSSYKSNENGMIVIRNLKPQYYTIVERQAPFGYAIDLANATRIIEIKPDDPNRMLQVIYKNEPLPKLRIIKIDKETGKVLEGAIFRVALKDSPEYNEYKTNEKGEIFLENLKEDWYVITEMKAPEGYLMNTKPILDPVLLVPGKTTEVVVDNQKMPTLTLKKVDSVTRRGLPNATFKLTKQGASEYTNVVTNWEGIAEITGLAAGWYTVEEIIAPTGYIKIDKPWTIELKPDEDAVLIMENIKKPSLTIKKVDSVTKAPLRNAEFTLYKQDGTKIGTWRSDEKGEIYLENIDAGIYKMVETGIPDGYTTITVEQEVVIEQGKDIVVTVENQAKHPMYISKVDAKTGLPLAGATFRVATVSGEFIGEYTTGRTGYATVTDLASGYYVVTEIKAPEGYSLSTSPKTILIKNGQPVTVEFDNEKLNGLAIKKIDSKTGDPIVGVKFKVTTAAGELIGSYTTGVGGIIQIADLAEGAYVIVETDTIDGYILDTTPQTVTLKKGETTTVEFKNQPLSGLQIRKIDETTGEPLAGVEFELRRANGELVGTYTTSSTGTIFIKDLPIGFYTVTELTALDGYRPDFTPRTIEMKSGEMTTVVYKNAKYPFLTIKKVDSESGKPLAGAKFKLMDNAYRELGVISTSELGIINITGLAEGTYYVQEIQAPDGYVLDNTTRQISLLWGKTTVLEVKNTAKGTLRIQKVDAVTGKPLYGAVFNIYDSKNNLLGEFSTDNSGMIIFPKDLPAGKYKIKEVKAPAGYVLDETVQTITVRAGETTEFTIKNEPVRGKIQIVKVAAEKNTLTKEKKGDLLKGAVFEIYDKDLKVVDRITTGADGIANSKALPLGKYGIKEIAAPKYYYTDGTPFYAEIKVHEDLIRFKVENKPKEISTTVLKRGNLEVLAGTPMRWDFKDIANTSNIPLDDFYWHDLIPTDATRAMSFSTGVWSEHLTYTAYYRTNFSDTYRVLKDKLSTTTNHELSLSPLDLKLKPTEFVTDVKLVFGTVEAGFHETTAPSITAYVLPNLIDGYQIVNRTDVGGRTEDEWTYSKDTWVTITIGQPRGFLPKTGF